VAVACTGAFLAFLDTTIVNIAFPDIAASFPGVERDVLAWVLDGYFVVIAALLVPAGGLADRFGHRRIFLIGVGVFAVASVLCAAAPSLGTLIAARVVQGAGAALIAPASLAIVLDSFPSERRALGVGLWGAAAAAAAAVGPSLGGALVELSGWRLVFLVNIPLGAAILWAGARHLREREHLDSRLPDLAGAGLLAAALALLTLAIVEGDDWGWTAPSTLAAFGAAALLLAAVAVRGHFSTPGRSMAAAAVVAALAGVAGIYASAWLGTAAGASVALALCAAAALGALVRGVAGRRAAASPSP